MWSAGVSLAVLLLMAVAGLATSNVLIARERDQKDAALRQRETALATAEANERASQANLRLARKAVDGLYTQLAEELYAGVPRMQPLQRKFLLQALEFYNEFSAQKGSDPETRFETGRAYRRVGSINHLLGHRPEASHALRRAIALLEASPRNSRTRRSTGPSWPPPTARWALRWSIPARRARGAKRTSVRPS